MDPIRNPYAPGAGQRPPELAGRDRELQQFAVSLERVAAGRPERSMVLSGLRGVGKTVWCEMAGDRPGAERGGMVIGMATKKYTVTLPEALAEEIRSEVGPGGFSAYVTRAIERQREQDRLGELVAWMQEEGGPLTQEELAAAEAELREAGQHFVEARAAVGDDLPLAG
jgi:Arc/MetJ-type ribon-helix-helix transcriptional regulator